MENISFFLLKVFALDLNQWLLTFRVLMEDVDEESKTNLINNGWQIHVKDLNVVYRLRIITFR